MGSSRSGSSRCSVDIATELYFDEKHPLYSDEEHGHSHVTTTGGIFTRTLISQIRLLVRCLIRYLSVLSPSFLHINPKSGQDGGVGLSSTIFLDGMRGLAAFVVFICHLTYGSFDVGHAYGARASSSRSTSVENTNDSILRLPIVRLLYSGPPMVAIFFVVSGFALSFKPIKLMHAQQHEALMKNTSSSMFRRGIRLFFPCFVSTFMVLCLAQLDLYKQTEAFSKQMRGIKEDHCYTQPDLWNQLTDYLEQIQNFVNVFDWSLYSGSIELDRHLWTIPVEYRCSMVLFMTHLLVARMSSRLRLSTIAALIVWGISWNRWDMWPFWAGMAIAELDLIRTKSSPGTDRSLLSYPGLAHDKVDSRADTNHRRFERLRSNMCWIILVVSLYLLSFPDAGGHATPGYMTLNYWIPASFTQKHRFWPNVGASLLVWTICNLDILRDRVFCWRPIQYLGRISFPLYVMHGPIIHTLGYMILPLSPKVETPEALWDFQLAFLKASAFIVIAVMWAADIFMRVVDTPCVHLAQRLENYFFIE
ncbi:hypothetical protein PV10_08800 [Exophiala mesophila]|uniref:Acyltransferase 3 domain-containing protein n=1 Tax=Exophiala mesophila TaxID=212818 RepID=A0A0D1Z5P9_EXOME|nr:uncharacterized protein PV10_08800 [Exophiala mesophila]KIV89214.1 hypothetical protein PV10_08800 [Exophiala mesophila]